MSQIDLVKVAAAQRAAKEEQARIERARELAMRGLLQLKAEAQVAGFTVLLGGYADNGEKYYLVGIRDGATLHAVATELVAGTYTRAMALTHPTLTLNLEDYTGTLCDLWAHYEVIMGLKKYLAELRAGLEPLKAAKESAEQALNTAATQLYRAEGAVDNLELDISVRIARLCMGK